MIELQIDMFLDGDNFIAQDWIDEMDFYCGVCFDVEAEDGNLEEEMKGIGVCIYDTETHELWKDAWFFGTIEATSGTTFRFSELAEMDWDIDDGNGVLNSKITGNAQAFNA